MEVHPEEIVALKAEIQSLKAEVTQTRKKAKNNRALVLLLVVLVSPIAIPLILTEWDLNFADGKVSGGVRSRNFQLPPEAKTIFIVMGLGATGVIAKNDAVKVAKGLLGDRPSSKSTDTEA